VDLKKVKIVLAEKNLKKTKKSLFFFTKRELLKNFFRETNVKKYRSA